MQTNANPQLTQKQRRLLTGLVEGLTQREAARLADLHPSSACIITKRPDFREELARLRAEAEARLVERLPDLIDQALTVLSAELNYPSDRRLRAVKLTLDLAARLAESPALAETPLATTHCVMTIYMNVSRLCRLFVF